MPDFSHLDAEGRARMVDVSSKPVTTRRAAASARVTMLASTVDALRRKALPKGDVLTVAQVAGIQAAKRTSELIPLCHPLPLSKVDVTISVQDFGVEIYTEAVTTGQTGVEMEALTAAAVAALTIYDMCKAVDRGMVIEGVRLESKSGGIHGDYRRPADGD
ncbi:MAG TPA: cyclic pyranopterin monophosphate synthase MoaC [Armatimonadota bacterium]